MNNNSREIELISDEEVIRVHGYANFGSMTPRDVIRDGVRKYAVGFSGGATQIAILRDHGLITKPKGIGYDADLTKKGKAYARAIYDDPCALRVALDRAEADKAAAVEAEQERCAALCVALGKGLWRWPDAETAMQKAASAIRQSGKT